MADTPIQQAIAAHIEKHGPMTGNAFEKIYGCLKGNDMEVGDRVIDMECDNDSQVTILAIHGEWAWCDDGTGEPCTYHLPLLKPLPAEPPCPVRLAKHHPPVARQGGSEPMICIYCESEDIAAVIVEDIQECEAITMYQVICQECSARGPLMTTEAGAIESYKKGDSTLL